MKKLTVFALFALITTMAVSCSSNKNDNFQWQIDSFDDIKVLRYKVHGFEDLTLQEKELIYYLNQASLWGRDIMFDQNFKYNLAIRRTLEAIYTSYEGDRQCEEWAKFEKYLKKVWFANGIHHHYGNDKFVPEFSRDYFMGELVAKSNANLFPVEAFGSKVLLLDTIFPIIFDTALYPSRNVNAGVDDVLKAYSMNY